MIKNDKKTNVGLLIALEVLFLAFVIALDLFSKAVIMPFLLENGRHFELWTGVIELQYAENYGASFGIFEGKTMLLTIITGATVAVLVGTLIYLRNDSSKMLRYGLLTIVGGAIGNIYDRITLEYVRDFIEYTFFDTLFGYGFAIGNIADIFCLVGVLMVIVYVFFIYKEGELKSRFKRFNK